MSKTLVEEYVEDPNRMRLFQQERAILEVTELIESLMIELGVSRAELAKRLGKTRGWVTQLLDGDSNKTIRTLADTFAVLGHEYHSCYCPIQPGKGVRFTISTDNLTATVTPATPVGSEINIHHPDGWHSKAKPASTTASDKTTFAEVIR